MRVARAHGIIHTTVVRDDRRLYRSSDDRILAGVAGGLAEHLHVDVRMVRAVFAILA